jgi:hypothetical protein
VMMIPDPARGPRSARGGTGRAADIEDVIITAHIIRRSCCPEGASYLFPSVGQTPDRVEAALGIAREARVHNRMNGLGLVKIPTSCERWVCKQRRQKRT